ncbi:hypothetical protein H8E77_07180 [bacterium]|nr:hypothetical protein [bacterium]
MTRKKLRWMVFLVVILCVVVYTGVGVVIRKWMEDEWYSFYKDILPIFIMIPAAYIAYAFQQRTSYLQALRNLWKQLIPAVQAAIQYTYLEEPD